VVTSTSPTMVVEPSYSRTGEESGRFCRYKTGSSPDRNRKRTMWEDIQMYWKCMIKKIIFRIKDQVANNDLSSLKLNSRLKTLSYLPVWFLIRLGEINMKFAIRVSFVLSIFNCQSKIKWWKIDWLFCFFIITPKMKKCLFFHISLLGSDQKYEMEKRANQDRIWF